MACGSCKSGGCSAGGCGKSGGCSTGGCNKLNTYDWLGNMLSPDKTEVDNIYEVRFKSTRKGFFRNVHGLRLYIGDHVVVESDRGYDVGILSLGGIMAELQMRKKDYRRTGQAVPRIFRKASEEDVTILHDARSREQETLVRSREIVIEMRIDMKLSDVEFQGDNAKAIFYYIAEHRVDFRELIKVLGREFKIRVEMRQIGLRHEAGLVGGIGVCGRELCCSTWLTDFKSVTTSAARYQNLSLNPMKISGQCGRLKCCLNFELDAYFDALADFPQVESIDTARGRAYVQKTDIFKGMLWFSYPQESTWYPLNTTEVKEVIRQNKSGDKPDVFSGKPAPSGGDVDPNDSSKSLDFVDVVGTNVPEREKRKKKRKKPSNSQSRDGRGESRASGNAGQSGQERPSRDRNADGSQQPREERPPRDPNQPRNDRPPRDRNADGSQQPRQDRPPRDPNQPRNDRPPRDSNADGSQQPRQERPPRDPNQPRNDRPPRDRSADQAGGPQPPRAEGTSQQPEGEGNARNRNQQRKKRYSRRPPNKPPQQNGPS